jgi:2,3-bisphosphoglycerate-independent phosphoglycerate mutase
MNNVCLIILDGYGLRERTKDNAVELSTNKNFLDLVKGAPFCSLQASGEYVGLPKGQMGNSEVGHLNIGAGRIVLQMQQKINYLIDNGEFYKNKELLDAYNYVLKNDSCLHIMGLCSNGGIHSNINHLFALIKMAKEKNIKNLVLHFFSDGRDSSPNSSKIFINQIENEFKNTTYKIATIEGRYYAMDRENNLDRVKLAFDCIFDAKSDRNYNNAYDAIDFAYKNGETDEFIKPILINGGKKVDKKDAVIFFNYREDRAREISKMLLDKKVKFVAFTSYDEKLKLKVAFKNDYVSKPLSKYISNIGLKQLKIAEETKYAHVTYFFNGGIEKAFKGEDRILIPMVNVPTYDLAPKMRAKEISEKAIENIKKNKYSLIVINFANCDMVGHTGNFEATKIAVDEATLRASEVAKEALNNGYFVIITADHGNAECMIDSNGNINTMHTTNKVPFYLLGDLNLKLQKNGKLANISPTIVDLMGIKEPKEFTEQSLIVK